MDADILFEKDDFMALIQAIQLLPRYGTLALSYENNKCNPERNVMKAKTVKGNNGKTFQVRNTFLCPVAGGIMGIRGEILQNDLNFEFFSPKFCQSGF